MPDIPSWVKSYEMLNIATSLWIRRLKHQGHNLVYLILSAPHLHSRCSLWIQVPACCFPILEVGFFYPFMNKTMMQVGSLSIYCKKPHLFPRSDSCRISLISSAVNQIHSICTTLRKSKMQDTYRNQAVCPFPGPNPSIHPRAEPVLSWSTWGLSISSTKAVSVSRTGTLCDSWVQQRTDLNPNLHLLC